MEQLERAKKPANGFAGLEAQQLRIDSFVQKGNQFVLGNPFLLGRVSIPQGNGTVTFDRIEINGHTKRHSDFINPSVSPSDCPALIVNDIPFPLQPMVKVPGSLN